MGSYEKRLITVECRVKANNLVFRLPGYLPLLDCVIDMELMLSVNNTVEIVVCQEERVEPNSPGKDRNDAAVNILARTSYLQRNVAGKIYG